jgi:hypothetical protein
MPADYISLESFDVMDANGPERHETPDGLMSNHQPGLEVASSGYSTGKADGGAWTGVAPVPAWQQPQEKTICGLRRTTFILSVLLAVAIVAAAVGTGVGAGFAVNNARR